MENYKFNPHHSCEFFPCHQGVDKEVFNCLFCYCPLYLLGDECGGDYKVNHGVKDCSECTKTHDENAYEYVMSKMKEVISRGSAFIEKKKE